MSKKWTRHELTNSMLKQLAAANNRGNLSLYPGVGYGAPSSRAALVRRGLAEEICIEIEPPYNEWAKPRKIFDTRATPLGELALVAARAAGW